MLTELVILILGAVGGWLANSQASKLSENATLIDDHIQDMMAFSTALEEYWLSEPKDLKEESIAAARVKGKHLAISQFYGFAEERLPLNHLREYQVLQLRLFQTGLGGKFETAEREADPDIAVDCVAISSQIIQVLRAGRREQLSIFWQLKKQLNPPFSKPSH